MLEVQSVHIWRGPLEVVRGVSLSARKGQIVSLIGTNGAGKSSLVMAIAGLLPIRSGKINFAGSPIHNLSPEDRSRRGIALVPEGRWLFSELSVEDNLRLGAFDRSVRAGAAERQERIYSLFPRLAERRRQIVSTLSGGEQQMASIGRALMTDPTLLILDEPSIGLAPIVVQQVFDALRIVVETGLTVLIVEQNVEAALALSQYGYVLSNGEIALEGPAARLLTDPKMIGSYLSGES